MQSYEQLRDLWRRLKDETVLSVYLPAEEHDPADRWAWRVRLVQLLEERRAELAGDRNELARFDAARDHIDVALARHPGILPGPAWAGFATPERLWAGNVLPAPAPDRVRWGRGPALAAHVRALKQARPVAVLLIDSWRARLFRYSGGQAEELVDLVPVRELAEAADAVTSKRAATSSGLRGETGRDAARRSLEVEPGRLVDEAAQAANGIAGEDGFLVVGGAAEAVSAAYRALENRFRGRILEDPALRVDMTAAEVRGAAARDASELSRALQDALTTRLLEEAGSGGRGRAGLVGVTHALALGQVDSLLLTPRFLSEHPEEADALVGLAFDSDSAVEVVAGAGAERLDAAAGGVAARLRYATAAAEVSA